MSDVVRLVRADQPPLPPLLGVSIAMRRVVALGRQFAPTALPILIVAPTGCGKELLTQHIHYWSGRMGELVDINCAALPEHLIESELFGHDAQAFTGARQAKPGLIEVAHSGTLFLDEISSLPLLLQPKLLRVLETGEVRRVGETAKRRVNVRVVAAAQEDLGDRMTAGAFRRDLCQRLAGVVLVVPPLAERAEDVVPLAAHFCALHGRRLEAGTEQVLASYPWPGNVRELRQVIDRAACLSDDPVLSIAAVCEAIDAGALVLRPSGADANGSDAHPETDRRQLIALCDAHGYDAQRIAAALGIGRTALFERFKAVGLSLRALRKSGKSANLRRTFRTSGS